MAINYRGRLYLRLFYGSNWLHIFFLALIIFLVIVFTGCAAVLGGQVASNKTNKNRILFLSISCSDATIMENIVKDSGQKGGVRTIAPIYDFTGSLYLYLTGVNNLDESSLGPMLIEKNTIVWQSNNLTASLPLSAGLTQESWNLTLWATTSNTIQTLTDLQSNAVLKGETHVDLTNTSSCHFNMGTRGVSGAGGLNITVAGARGFPATGFVSSSVPDQPNMGIYLTDYTGKIVQDSSGSNIELSSGDFFVVDGSNPTGVTAPVRLNKGGIPAGTYNLEVRLRLQPDGIRYVYSEPIVIGPNMTTTKELLVPDILGAVNEPSNLISTYKTGSENKDAGVYQVRFQWQDNSNNELGFELQLAQLDSGMIVQSLPTNDTEWTSLIMGSTILSYGENVFESQNYVSGSTMSNANELQLKLNLGKRYLARIRALGDGANSAWSYMEFPSSGDAGYSVFSGSTVSRFYISYNLRGGVYDSDGTGPATPSTSDELLYFFCHENGGGIQLLAPTGGGRDSRPSLLLNGVEVWSGWLQGNLSEYPGNAQPYNYGFPENLVLIANYGSSYPLEGTWLKVNGRSVNPYPGATVRIPRNENNNTLHFDLTLPQDAYGIANFTYDAVTVIFSWPDTHGPLFIFDTNTSMIPGQPLRISVSTLGMFAGDYFMKIECRKGSSVSSMVSSIAMI